MASSRDSPRISRSKEALDIMPTCLIGLGANLGDRRGSLEAAIDLLSHEPNVRLLARGRWHETDPVGGPAPQPRFLNGAAVIETSLSPEALLDGLQRIERSLGRARRVRRLRWGPRTIDLDLLLYDQMVLSTPRLTLPHPRMAWRRFVLTPASEVAGQMVHPTTGWTITRLLEHLDATPQYVALAGGIAAGKTALARRLTEVRAARPVHEPLDLDRLAEFYADRSGQAWRTELEFLHRRVGLLAPQERAWADPRRLVVSDFWFDQSRAFARVWLPESRWDEFERLFEQARSRVVRPRLIVLLDVPADRLARRVRHRGRSWEQGLDEAQLERIARTVNEATHEPDVGPVLRLVDPSPAEALREVTAAVDAMSAV